METRKTEQDVEEKTFETKTIPRACIFTHTRWFCMVFTDNISLGSLVICYHYIESHISIYIMRRTWSRTNTHTQLRTRTTFRSCKVEKKYRCTEMAKSPIKPRFITTIWYEMLWSFWCIIWTTYRMKSSLFTACVCDWCVSFGCIDRVCILIWYCIEFQLVKRSHYYHSEW